MVDTPRCWVIAYVPRHRELPRPPSTDHKGNTSNVRSEKKYVFCIRVRHWKCIIKLQNSKPVPRRYSGKQKSRRRFGYFSSAVRQLVVLLLLLFRDTCERVIYLRALYWVRQVQTVKTPWRPRSMVIAHYRGRASIVRVKFLHTSSIRAPGFRSLKFNRRYRTPRAEEGGGASRARFGVSVDRVWPDHSRESDAFVRHRWATGNSRRAVVTGRHESSEPGYYSCSPDIRFGSDCFNTYLTATYGFSGAIRWYNTYIVLYSLCQRFPNILSLGAFFN